MLAACSWVISLSAATAAAAGVRHWRARARAPRRRRAPPDRRWAPPAPCPDAHACVNERARFISRWRGGGGAEGFEPGSDPLPRCSRPGGARLHSQHPLAHLSGGCSPGRTIDRRQDRVDCARGVAGGSKGCGGAISRAAEPLAITCGRAGAAAGVLAPRRHAARCRRCAPAPRAPLALAV